METRAGNAQVEVRATTGVSQNDTSSYGEDNHSILLAEYTGHNTSKTTLSFSSHDATDSVHLAGAFFTNDLTVPPGAELDLRGFLDELAILAAVIFDPIAIEQPDSQSLHAAMFVNGTRLPELEVAIGISHMALSSDTHPTFFVNDNSALVNYCLPAQCGVTFPSNSPVELELLDMPPGQMLVDQSQNLFAYLSSGV